MTGVANPRVVANGINGATGQYDRAPMELDDLARALRRQDPAAVATAHVAERGRKLAQPAFSRALPWGVAPYDVARAGWGIVFPGDVPDAVKAALQPLVAHRRAQVGDDARVKELTYHPGETATAWLARHDVAWHNITPTKIPYYLLWVGSPEQLPYAVTHEIDSDYCVGLLDFETPDEYARYAASVVRYETNDKIANSREAVFFATRHPFDEATLLSADWLIGPLADGVPASGTTAAEPAVAAALGFRQRRLVAEQATRQSLTDLLTMAEARPSLLFTASHGLVWPNGDPRQFPAQGALLCQDWPGFGAMSPSHYFSAADVPDEARPAGMVTFHFACYGAGTPAVDEFHFERNVPAPAIAPKPFTAALPRRLLAHPSGGALACIGHIERAWGYSITGGVTSPQIRAFQRALAQILAGRPVGLAVQEFDDLSATLSNVLTRLLGSIHHGSPVDDVELVSTWTHRNDAAGFVLLGDPAVRLRLDQLL
jgi:hypothetical protein